MSNSSWAPDEDAATISSEDKWLQGAFLCCVAYGFVATLSIQCFFMLIQGFNKKKLFRDIPLLTFVVLTFSMSTAFIGTVMQFTQQAFVDDRNFPGGPSAYEIVEFSIPIDAAANDLIVVSTILSDALLLWRCTIIYANSALNVWILYGVAAIFWITEFILGVLFIVSLTSMSIFGTVNLTLAFWCFSLALNILATVAIVSRLFYYRYQLSRAFNHPHLAQYTGIMAMIVESELLYSGFLILFIVPFVREDPLANIFAQPPSLVQSIAALMIVYRVAQGKGWTKNTYTAVSTMNAKQGSKAIQLSNFSGTLRAAQSETAFTHDEAKSVGTGIQVTQDIYTRKDSGSSVEGV